MSYKTLLALLGIFLIVSMINVVACGDDDDDDDDSTPGTVDDDDDDTTDDDDDDTTDDDDDDTTDDDDDDTTDDDDDDDTVNTDVCKSGTVVAGHDATSLCTGCHKDGGIAPQAHGGAHDAGAPDTCMAASCHACPE